jgi:hypothetical protein
MPPETVADASGSFPRVLTLLIEYEPSEVPLRGRYGGAQRAGLRAHSPLIPKPPLSVIYTGFGFRAATAPVSGPTSEPNVAQARARLRARWNKGWTIREPGRWILTP